MMICTIATKRLNATAEWAQGLANIHAMQSTRISRWTPICDDLTFTTLSMTTVTIFMHALIV